MRILRILLSFSVTACLQLAVASTIVEYDRATFQTALSGATLSGQNFDSLPLGTITTVDGVTFTPSLGTALVTDEFETTTSPNGLGSTSDGFFDPTESLSITFSTPITAFAIDINTFASQSGDYEAAVNDVSESLISSVFDTFPNSETGQFIGFTDSSPFTSILITGVPDPGTGNGFCGTSPLCSYTVDSLVYGDASAVVAASGTPEPSTSVFLGMGILAAGFFARRRNNRSV